MVSTGIQKLVSTYEHHAKICPNFLFFWGGGGTPDQLKSKVPISAQISFGRYSRPTQIQSAKICQNFHLGGWGVLQTDIPGILEWGHSRNFEPKILVTGMCSASQIVSHILRMWRLISTAIYEYKVHTSKSYQCPLSTT